VLRCCNSHVCNDVTAIIEYSKHWRLLRWWWWWWWWYSIACCGCCCTKDKLASYKEAPWKSRKSYFVSFCSCSVSDISSGKYRGIEGFADRQMQKQQFTTDNKLFPPCLLIYIIYSLPVLPEIRQYSEYFVFQQQTRDGRVAERSHAWFHPTKCVASQ